MLKCHRYIGFGDNEHFFAAVSHGSYISLSLNLPTVQSLNKIGRIMVNDIAVTKVKFCDLLHILVGKCEVPNVDILLHTLHMNGLRQN